MNQQPNPKPEKPIVELIQDIHIQRNPGRRTGMVSPKLVDRVLFFATCVFLAVAASGVIAMIWDLADWMATVRWIASVGVVLVALRIFGAINDRTE